MSMFINDGGSITVVNRAMAEARASWEIANAFSNPLFNVHLRLPLTSTCFAINNLMCAMI
ncbi:hypothetical protein JCM16161A_10880 [Vulcanisaeta sp. JCM 16161]